MTVITILALYAGAAVMLALSYVGRVNAAMRLLALALAAVGLLLHSAHLYQVLLAPAGLSLDLLDVVALLCWQVAILAVLGALFKPLQGLSALLLGVAAAGVPAIRPDAVGAVARISGWQIESHVLLSVLAYSLLFVAALIALLLFWQHRRLRRHRPAGGLRLLPPMETTERLLFTLVLVGFIVLSLAIFSGLIFIEDMFAQHLVHKTILSIVAWVVFAALLLGRWRFGWRGPTAVAWTLSGFGLLLLAYFGSRVILEVILNRHWG